MLERVAGMLDDVCLAFLIEIKTFFWQKNVSQTSSNMPATGSNFVKPTNVI